MQLYLKGQKQRSLEADMDLEQPTPKLSFYPLRFQSPEPTGVLTPPLRTAGSVPFLWEEAPGKPRTWDSFVSPPPSPRSLDLPPVLQSDIKSSKSNLHSPTLLDDPFLSSSVSGSFSRSSKETSPETEKRRALTAFDKHESGRFLGLWGRRSLRAKGRIMNVEGRGDACPVLTSSSSLVLRTSCDDAKVKSARLKRSGSVSLATNHVWATITGSFRQVVPWKAKSLKKDKLRENVNHDSPTASSQQ